METTRKIVALGGGELKDLETLEIDKRIVELTGKTRPTALFIPTASGDPIGYMDTFAACYGKRLGCQTRTLSLIQTPPAFEEMSALVLDSDLIYVGGGNTYRMMKIWRRLGLDTVLAEAASPRYCFCRVSARARFAGSDTVTVILVPFPAAQSGIISASADWVLSMLCIVRIIILRTGSQVFHR